MSHTNPLPELPEPFVHCYEWKDLRNGTRRSFSAAPYNGMRCSNSLALFTAEQFQAVQREAYELGARSTAAQPAGVTLSALVSKWRHAAEHLGLEGLASLSDCADELETAMAHSAAAQPAGWKLVPIEPTREMLEAVAPFPAHLRIEHPDPNDPWHRQMEAATLADQAEAASTYREMLAAAPPAASGDSTPPSPVQGDPSGALRPEPEAVGQGRWQPIETAPKDGTTIIVGRDMGDFGFIRGYARFEGAPGSFLSGWISNGFSEIISNLGLAHPTLWQPLPEPPQAASGSRGD